MKRLLNLSALAGLLILTSCAAVPRYQPIDLRADLDPATLARYKAATAQGVAGHCGTLLEKTDGRLLGALLFWKNGSVEVMQTSNGPVYMVAENLGLGPVCIAYLNSTWSTYDAQGKRISTMGGASSGLGCIIMTHWMENLKPSGAWHKHWMGHFIHHMLNFSDMDGKKGFGLFTMPNQIMFEQ